MSMLLSAFEKAMSFTRTYTRTENGAVSLSTPDPSGISEGRVSLFFKAIRGIDDTKLYEYLQKSLEEDLIDTFIITFNCRDPRGGKGERDIGRKLLKYLFMHKPVEFSKVFHLIPEYGRWDDLLLLFPKATIAKTQTHKNVQDEVVKFFCEKLKEDIRHMHDGKPVSICAKWAPTEGDVEDKLYHVVDTICEHLDITKRMYRKEYIVPLRSYLQIVEVYMSTNKWDLIQYSKVPSHAMKNLKKAFEKHSPEAFTAWKESLVKGEVKVNAKVLHPHELIREIRTKGSSDEVTESQWKVLEDEAEKLGVLEDVCVVCDTSGSMQMPNHLPLDISVALGILISKLTKGPFNGHVITFEENPRFIKIEYGSLYDRYYQLASIPWGGSTNLQATFDMILERGKIFKLTNADMPKRLIIISDMQFNYVEGRSTLTNFQEIERKYAESNYTRPQLVFWNVNGKSEDFPVDVNDNGTCLVSGSSPAILKSIISAKTFTSYAILKEELDSKRYKKIKDALM